MGTFLLKQRNNDVYSGVTPKSIQKTITLKRFMTLTPNFDSKQTVNKKSTYFWGNTSKTLIIYRTELAFKDQQ